uniref:Uncharacterized protein n=1 Tax=Romanomermis culicivorax TaxID=13658 RepID=A0A915KJU1_ROMCU
MEFKTDINAISVLITRKCSYIPNVAAKGQKITLWTVPNAPNPMTSPIFRSFSEIMVNLDISGLAAKFISY